MSAFYGVCAVGTMLYQAAPVLLILGFIAVLSAVFLGASRSRAMVPVLTVDCHVAGKRAVLADAAMPAAHFVTFEMSGGDHVEFAVQDAEYGQLAEGDEGSLTYQGVQYLGFERRK